jgi:hypothetical protein
MLGSLADRRIAGKRGAVLSINLEWLKRYWALVLLVTFVIIGVLTFKDYGLSWDEPQSREDGQVTYNYIFNADKSLLTFKDRDYGVAFELPLMIVEKAFGMTDTRNIFFLRHLLTHLFFLFSAFCCFLLVDRLFANKVIATIAFLLYVLSPVIYAHSFFNSKDVPFASGFMICFFLSARAFGKYRLRDFVVLGIANGLLINIRIMGILLMIPVCLLLVSDLIVTMLQRKRTLKVIGCLLIYVFVTLAVLYGSWPYLWVDPVNNFLTAFHNMARFRYDHPDLLLGSFVDSGALPWYYTFVWFGVTNPLTYLALGCLGIFLLFQRLIIRAQTLLRDTIERQVAIYFFCFFVPILSVIVLKSVLYDTWRQLFFIYPAFVLLCSYGLHRIWNSKARPWILGIVGAGLIWTAAFMVGNAPFQHVYFNELVSLGPPESLRKSFEMDYWGTSYYRSLQYIAKTDASRQLDILASDYPGEENAQLMPANDRSRLNFVHRLQDAKYFITTYRWHPQDYAEFAYISRYDIRVLNNTINTVFQLKQTIQASSGRYVSAEGGGGGILSGNRDRPDTWESFFILGDADKGYSFRTYDGKYMSCVSDGNGAKEILANASSVGPSELFQIQRLPDGRALVQHGSDGFLYVDPTTSRLGIFAGVARNSYFTIK